MRNYIIFFMIFATANAFSNTEKPKLADYKFNVYSQFGEDGIIAKILEIIGTTSKVVVEFGAADGFSCSNTANLWTKDTGWTGILIESDPILFKKVVTNVAPYNCITINKRVGISPQDSLESILQQEEINGSIDLLSIDVDGNDYYIFQSIQRIRPRIIICEYNASIPAHIDFYPEYNNYIGSSVAALQRIAKEKNYTLVAITDANCIFVCDEEINKFSAYNIDREHIRIDCYLSYIISDFSARYKVIGTQDFKDEWGWHGSPSTYQGNGNFKVIPALVKRQ